MLCLPADTGSALQQFPGGRMHSTLVDASELEGSSRSNEDSSLVFGAWLEK